MHERASKLDRMAAPTATAAVRLLLAEGGNTAQRLPQLWVAARTRFPTLFTSKTHFKTKVVKQMAARGEVCCRCAVLRRAPVFMPEAPLTPASLLPTPTAAHEHQGSGGQEGEGGGGVALLHAVEEQPAKSGARGGGGWCAVTVCDVAAGSGCCCTSTGCCCRATGIGRTANRAGRQ